MLQRSQQRALTPQTHSGSNLDGNPLSSSCPGSSTWATFKGYSYCATVCSMNGTQLATCDGWNAGGVLDLHGLGIDHLPVAVLAGIATQPSAMYVGLKW